MRISCSNAGYTMFRGSVKSTGKPLHSPISCSLPLPCVTVCHNVSTGLYIRHCSVFQHVLWSPSLHFVSKSCYTQVWCLPLALHITQTVVLMKCTGLFVSPSGISELDCATTKTDTAERSISVGRESLQVFFVLGTLAYFQVPPLGGSRDEK